MRINRLGSSAVARTDGLPSLVGIGQQDVADLGLEVVIHRRGTRAGTDGGAVRLEFPRAEAVGLVCPAEVREERRELRDDAGRDRIVHRTTHRQTGGVDAALPRRRDGEDDVAPDERGPGRWLRNARRAASVAPLPKSPSARLTTAMPDHSTVPGVGISRSFAATACSQSSRRPTMMVQTGRSDAGSMPASAALRRPRSTTSARRALPGP